MWRTDIILLRALSDDDAKQQERTMNINIICVGKLKEKYLRDAVSEYVKRISRFANTEMIELPDEKIPDNASQKQEENVKQREGDLIMSRLKDGYTIALCVEGKQLSSERFAAHLNNVCMRSSRINFIIGGSLGLDERVKKAADMRMSFSEMTFPHQLMRVILAEQIYRAFKINEGEKYHK